MKRYLVGLTLFIIFGSVAASQAGQSAPVLREKKVREAVTAFIMERTQGAGVEIRVRRIGYSGDLQVPPGRVSFEFVPPGQWDGWGRATLAMIVRVDDRVVRNLSIPVEVEALADMVVAIRPLARGEVITEGDVALQKRDLSAITGKVAYNTAEVVGKEVKINIRGNTPVRTDFLEKVPLVKYGQLVTIVAENGMLRVTAQGKCKGSAGEGDLVMVQNLSSHKDVQARVVDSGTVAVDF